MILSHTAVISKIIGKAMKQTHLNNNLRYTVRLASDVPSDIKSLARKNSAGASTGTTTSTVICFRAIDPEEVKRNIPDYQSKIATMIINNIAVNQGANNSFGANNVLIADTSTEDHIGNIFFLVIIDRWED